MRSATGQLVVLLMNDQAVEALAIGEALEKAGYKVAGPLRTTADALLWIEREQPDLAILGLLPADASGEAIAEALQKRRIPFGVHSANQPAGHVTGATGAVAHETGLALGRCGDAGRTPLDGCRPTTNVRIFSTSQFDLT